MQCLGAHHELSIMNLRLTLQREKFTFVLQRRNSRRINMTTLSDKTCWTKVKKFFVGDENFVRRIILSDENFGRRNILSGK